MTSSATSDGGAPCRSITSTARRRRLCLTVLGRVASTASRTRSCRNATRSPSSITSPAASASRSAARTAAGAAPRERGQLVGREPAAEHGGQLEGVPGARPTAARGGSSPSRRNRSRQPGPGEPGGSRRRPPPASPRAGPRSSSVSRNGCPRTPASAFSSAGSGVPPSRSVGDAGHRAPRPAGPSAIVQRAGCLPAGQRPRARPRPSSPDRTASSHRIRCAASCLVSVPSAASVAASAHCTSSSEISTGAAQRGPLQRFLHLPQQPEPLVGGVAEVAQHGRVHRRVVGADTSASSSGPNGITCAAASPAPRKTLMPCARASAPAASSRAVLPRPARPVDQHGAAAAGPQGVELVAQRLDLDLPPPQAKGHPPLLIQLGNRQPQLVTAQLALGSRNGSNK